MTIAQLTGTVGIVTGILLLIGLGLLITYATDELSYGAEKLCLVVGIILCISVLVIWVILGSLIGLNALWNWNIFPE